MNRSHEIVTGALCLALLAAAFCAWSALGNEVNLCVTAGCSLYQDTSVAGISLWWLGTGVFAALCFLALLGATHWGRILAALALTGDVLLLLVMALTAPCLSCLIAAVFFALIYMSFRQAAATRSRASKPGRSILVLVWGVLFIVNLGAVARSQSNIWAITDNGQEASVHMFFSPSCTSCREGIAILSGHVDVAFYPLAETDADVYRVAHMIRRLDQGSSMAEALAASQDIKAPSGFAAWNPDMVWLRFRMLRNKSHVFMAGAQTVPFFEYHGLPSMLVKQAQAAGKQGAARAGASAAGSSIPATGMPGGGAGASYPPGGASDVLPSEPQIAGQCGGQAPCPE
ncbi:MAG: hypothetical protein PHI96_06890 [Desulfovibrio sp.]|nr:hypothetical protein [Desulfovibrio sp.]